MHLWFTVAILLFVSVMASAQSIKSRPLTGVETTVGVGDVLYERFPVQYVRVAEPEEGASLPNVLDPGNIEAKQILVIQQESRRLVACSKESRDYSDPVCLTDRDLDGTFDVINTALGLVPRKLPSPIRYRIFVKEIDVSERGLVQRLVFLGISQGSIRFGYREFLNDLARPSFSEELTLPLSEFPQTVRVKSTDITLLSIGPRGLTYRID